jgi:hypothetical protein
MEDERIHEDLEERFQLATDVDFQSNIEEFEGLRPLEIEIKKKIITKIPIKHVELGKPKGGLF